jgi:hypothetical protein
VGQEGYTWQLSATSFSERNNAMSYNLGDDDNDHFLDSLLTPIETTFDPTEEKYEHGSYQFYRSVCP